MIVLSCCMWSFDVSQTTEASNDNNNRYYSVLVWTDLTQKRVNKANVRFEWITLWIQLTLSATSYHDLDDLTCTKVWPPSLKEQRSCQIDTQNRSVFRPVTWRRCGRRGEGRNAMKYGFNWAASTWSPAPVVYSSEVRRDDDDDRGEQIYIERREKSW